MEKSVKSILSTINNRQESINKIIADIGHSWGNEKEVLDLFLNAPDYCLSHPKVINLLADFLQCINDESQLSHFGLKDIESLYRMNLEILPNDLSQYEDLAHYYISVLDDDVKFSDVIKKGVSKASLVLDNLNKLEQNIK
jgi:hypothetical protein